MIDLRTLLLRALARRTLGLALSLGVFALSVSSPAQSPYRYRINCGGGAVGGLAADVYYGPNSSAQRNLTSRIDLSAVSAPLAESAYRDVRIGGPRGFVYRFPKLVPNRPYRVRLHFFEKDNLDGHTVNVGLGGRLVLEGFDIGGSERVSVQDFTAAADAAGALQVGIGSRGGPACLSAVEVLDVRVLYVAPDGNDAWSGGLAARNPDGTDGPFATVARARDEVRRLKETGRFDRPVTVYLRGGTYTQSSPIVFEPRDSGTGENRIVYEAYPGERPAISSGVALTGWQDATLNGAAVWKLTLPGVAAGRLYFRDLWVDGKRRRRSRTPDVGFFRIRSGEPGGLPDGHNDRKFVYRDDDLDGIGNVEGGEAVLLAQWTSSHLPLTGIDRPSKTLSFAKETAFRLGDGERYWIENTLSGLTQPGEWALRPATGELFYRPMPGESKTRTRVVAPVADSILRLEGAPQAESYVHDLVFRGLAFENASWWFPPNFQAGGPGLGDARNTWTLGIFENAGFDTDYNRVGLGGAIRADGLLYTTFERNVVRNVAGYAFDLRDGSRHNRLDGNLITDVGGGVKLGRRDFNGRGPLETTDNLIVDNTIRDGGYQFTGALGITWVFARHNLIAHNEVSEFNYSGIGGGAFDYSDLAGTGENVIAYNDVHHVGQNRNFSPNEPVLGDLGGIYLYDGQPGTRILNNRVHHVTGEYAGWGIYLDQRSRSVTVRNNLVYRNKSGAFFSWLLADRLITVENNVFAFGQEGQFTIGYFDAGFVTVRRNVVLYAGGGPDADPTLYGNMYWYGSRGQLVSDYNLYWNINGNGYWANSASSGDFDVASPDFQSYFQVDAHSVFADPLFQNPAADDFRLRPDSPLLRPGTAAYALGFDPNAIRLSFGPRYGALFP